jgi:ATP/maltotriose-dependent transcriptional regulator MalT
MQYIPNIMGAVLERLTQQSKTSELKTMCLQVVSKLLSWHGGMVLLDDLYRIE